MQYEIDFLPVGDGEKGGDAITFRYGDFSDPSKQFIVVIDGGTKESGKALVDHIKEHYRSCYVDLVVATHLHQDHTSGLTEILENLNVGKLAMHLPWNYTHDIKKMTATEASSKNLETKLQKSIAVISTLEELAIKKNITIVEPFYGDFLLGEEVLVLGPTEEYYKSLLANFEKTPEVKKEFSLLDNLTALLQKAIEWTEETLHIETLRDDYEDTCPENNSSIIILFSIEGKRFLFTGDAGKDALTKVIELTKSSEINLSNIDFLDVPHHGSKRNMGPTILNHLMPKIAYISCPKEGDPKHPSRKMINALIRRGCPPHTTKGRGIWTGNCPLREGWGPIQPETFFNKVEI